jgi:chromosome segregation ATPase
MDIKHSKIKSMISILEELNDAITQKDKDLEILKKETDYLNNLVSLNKFDLENIEEEKNNLRKQCKALQENDYKCKAELQDTKMKLLEYEKEHKQSENLMNTKYLKKIDELQEKLDKADIVITQYSLEIEELNGLLKIKKREIEDLENGRVSAKEYMSSHIKKDSYDTLNQKYEKLESELKSKEILVEELYSEIYKYDRNRLNLSFEQYISHIGMKFKQLDNEISLLKKDNSKKDTDVKEMQQKAQIVSQVQENDLSIEEQRLMKNLGL